MPNTQGFLKLIKRDYIKDHETILNKFKRIQIIQCMFSDHSEIIKLEINDRKISGKNP